LGIQESFVLEYGGLGRRGLRKCRLLLSTYRMLCTEDVNDTVFGFQEPRLEGNRSIDSYPRPAEKSAAVQI